MKNLENFKKRADRVIDCIVREKRTRDDYTYWALCLDDSRQSPREIDTCATSLCVSLLQLYESTASQMYKSNRDSIQGGINTLIQVRKKDGAWPSVVKPKCMFESPAEAKGDVALIDNYFALTALLDVGFLSRSFAYKNLADKSFENIEYRTSFILQTVEWLMKNKAVEGGKGWYNTSTRQNVSSPTMLATSNIVSVLFRIKAALNEIDPLYYQEWIERIDFTINESIDLMLVNVNEDGGIGFSILAKQGNGSSLPHTCRLVDVLLSQNNAKDTEELQDAVNYILKNCTSEVCSAFRDKPIDLFSEQYTLALDSEGEICIQHEHCIEGIILYTLIGLINDYHTPKSLCGKISFDERKVKETIQCLMLALEHTQNKGNQYGKYNGIFRCRIERPEGKYPVYSSYYGFTSIWKYQNLFHSSSQTGNHVEINRLMTQCKSIRIKFAQAIARYGINDKNHQEISQLKKYISQLDQYVENLMSSASDAECTRIKSDIEIMTVFYSERIGDEN